MGVIDRTHQHAEHDPFVIAQYAADDLRPSERRPAADLIASCRACASLAADLTAIMAATAALPPIPARRDFRLTEADATRLRRGAWRRRFGFLGSPRFAFTQPLGLGIATLGLVGVLLSGASLPFGGFAASAPEPQGAQAPAGGAGSDTTSAAEDGTGSTNRSGSETTDGGPESPPIDTLTIASPEPPAASPLPLPMAQPSVDPSLTIMAAPAQPSPAAAVPALDPSSGKSGASPGGESTTGVADAGVPEAQSTSGTDTDVVPGVVPTGQLTAEGGFSWTAWLGLLVIGLALASVRPIARRIAGG